MDVRQGDIVLARFGSCAGSVQGGERPAIVTSNNIGNRFSPVISVMPLTSRNKNNLPVHGVIPATYETGLNVDSVFLGEQLRVIDKTQIVFKIGRVSDEVMDHVFDAIVVNNLPEWRKDGAMKCAYGQKTYYPVSSMKIPTQSALVGSVC